MPTITYTPIPILVFGASLSTTTSNAFLVQDYNELSVSLVSNTTICQVTLQGSNDDGLQPIGGPYGVVPALTWSNVTTITAQGIYSVTPGFRWARFGSPVSACTVWLAGNAF